MAPRNLTAECGKDNFDRGADIPTNINVLIFGTLSFSPGIGFQNNTASLFHPSIAACCAPNSVKFSACYGYIEIPDKLVTKDNDGATLEAVNKCIREKGGGGGNQVQLAKTSKKSSALIESASLTRVGLAVLAISGLFMF